MRIEYIVQRYFEDIWIDEHVIPDGFIYSGKRTPKEYARHSLLFHRTALFPGIKFRLVKRTYATEDVLEE